jgi:hypothetical protein
MVQIFVTPIISSIYCWYFPIAFLVGMCRLNSMRKNSVDAITNSRPSR